MLLHVESNPCVFVYVLLNPFMGLFPQNCTLLSTVI